MFRSVPSFLENVARAVLRNARVESLRLWEASSRRPQMLLGYLRRRDHSRRDARGLRLCVVLQGGERADARAGAESKVLRLEVTVLARRRI
jgi:hypothetical protein